MIFVDTSAIYALLDRADEHHSRAKETWLYLLESGEHLITTNYVVVECCALAQDRLGLKAVRSVQDDILPVLNMHWVNEVAHAKAMTALLTANRAKLSLVDCSSFVVMRDLELRVAFAFDRHFDQEDFEFPKIN